MAKKRKVDFNLASEVFEDASLADTFPSKEITKTLIPLNALKANPFQPRIQMEESNIIELANSIDANGLLQPITVLKNGDLTYTIVFGHRRAAASEYLGKETIEATIINSIEEKELAITPIVENLQRKDMEPIETAIALDKVLKMKIVSTQEDLSKSIGLTQGRVSKLLSILKLSNDVLLKVKKSSYKDVTILAALNKVSNDMQLEVFKKIQNLKREDALLYIQKIAQKKTVELRRVIHSNNIIKINTKGISKEQKEQLMQYLQNIEDLLK